MSRVPSGGGVGCVLPCTGCGVVFSLLGAGDAGENAGVAWGGGPVGRFVSLYAGAGGLDLGFVLAGFAPVWVNDVDPVALDTHSRMMGWLGSWCAHVRGLGYVSRLGDVGVLSDGELPGVGCADVVVGGPPCQGFSVAGRMDPGDVRSGGVFRFLDVVERVRPAGFVMENVAALSVSRRWAGVRARLVGRADGLGFVTRWMVVDAADFGVPQSRRRVLWMGVRRGCGVPREMVATTPGCAVTVREALAVLPRWGLPGNDSVCAARIVPARTPVVRRSAFAGMLVNGGGRILDLDAPSLTLPASMGGNRTPIVDQRALELGVDPWVVGYHARLRAGGAVVGSVPGFLRRLTVEEAAVLQSFPVGMPWSGSRSARFRQIGNAVPPRLGLAVGLAVRASLGLGGCVEGAVV